MRQYSAAFASLFLSTAIVLEAASPHEISVFTVSPPEIVTVDTTTWKVVARVVLPGVPAAIAILPGSRLFYVLVNGATGVDGSLARGPSQAVAFDRLDHKIVARLDVGWGASRMALADDGNLIACFREQSPRRAFERPPSIASGIFSVARQSKLAGKSSAISLIDTRSHTLAWQRELGPREVIFWPAAKRFCVADPRDSLEIVDMQGVTQQVPLPARRFKRKLRSSPDGRWLYVVEDGNTSVEKQENVSSRVFVIDAQSGRLARTWELENESLTPLEGAGRDGIVVANQSGVIRNFAGTQLKWLIDAGRHFRFTRWMDEERGLLIAGKNQLKFVRAEETQLSWSLDWHRELQGEPGADIVRIPHTSIIAVPVMQTNQGLDLDRVVFVDLQARRVLGGVPVGRRGRMAAKSIGLALASGISSSSAWAHAVPGPDSFNWNGFAIDVAHGMEEAFRLLVGGNPLLKASPDGGFAYAMSRFGNDLTLIKLPAAAITGIIAIGGGSQGLVSAGPGPLLCSWATKRLTWINLETNQVQSTAQPCHGRFDRVQVDSGQQWVVTFGDHCAMFWDIATGKRVAGIENLGKPRLVL